MGYRTQNNFDDAERDAWKGRPFRDRYNWRFLVWARGPRSFRSGAHGASLFVINGAAGGKRQTKAS